MRTPGVKISFDEKIGLYTAEDHGSGLCLALGRTPDEARAMLELVRSRWSDCPKCNPGRIQKNTGDCRCPRP